MFLSIQFIGLSGVVGWADCVHMVSAVFYALLIGEYMDEVALLHA